MAGEDSKRQEHKDRGNHVAPSLAGQAKDKPGKASHGEYRRNEADSGNALRPDTVGAALHTMLPMAPPVSISARRASVPVARLPSHK